MHLVSLCLHRLPLGLPLPSAAAAAAQQVREQELLARGQGDLVAAVLSVGIEIPLASCEKLLFSHLLRGGGGGAGTRQPQKKEVEAK